MIPIIGLRQSPASGGGHQVANHREAAKTGRHFGGLSMNRRSVLKLATAASLAFAGGRAGANRFSERPIRLVIPFAAGGNNDVLGRILAQKMGDLLGQTIVIENKAGADGAIAAMDVARAKPDGHSLLFGTSSTHVVTPALMEKPSYDPLNDFAQLTVFAIQPQCIAVNNDLPVSDLRDLVTLVKGTPGKYSYGAVASSLRLGVELLKREVGGLDLVAVPYKGAPLALQDLMADRIQIYPSHPGTIAQLHNAGRLRILAIFNDVRIKSLPEVPTAIEAGFPKLVISTFNLFCTTAGTPRTVIKTLYDAIQATVSSDEFIAHLEREGSVPVTDSTPEKATRFVAEASARLTPLIKTLRPQL